LRKSHDCSAAIYSLSCATINAKLRTDQKAGLLSVYQAVENNPADADFLAMCSE